MQTMRMVLALLVFICCLAMSNGTLKFLKSKLKGDPLIYPVTKYRTVKYLSSPVVIPEPVTYVRPVYVSTYTLSSPSFATYTEPIQTYSAPYAYASTYTAPVVVYPQRIAYDPSPIETETVRIKPTSSYGVPLLEGHYSAYDEDHAKH